MDKLLISVFDSDEAAYDGLAALRELHHQGDITLYASTVVTKDQNGKASVQDDAAHGPRGILVGAVGGGLVGMVGGPVTAVIGASAGAIGGAMYDDFHAGIALDVVDEASRALEPGTAAIVADIDESWMTPIDTRLGALGATTVRQVPGQSLDVHLTHDAEVASQEMRRLHAELKDANGEARTQVVSAIKRQRQQLDELVSQIDAALSRQQSEFESHMAKLHAQTTETAEGQHERINARIADLEASNQSRRATLTEARRLATESLQLAAEALKP